MPTSSNHAPSITGTPAAAAATGTPYSFQPSATDADGDALTFSISNKPSWATFSTTTGSLTGTPAAGDVGSTRNIAISVSDGKTSASLSTFSITVTSDAPVSGASLFVAMDGNDGNDCSSSKPCKTIDRVVALTGPGSVVSVAAGTYGGFTIDKSGSSATPVVYRASGAVVISNPNGYGIYIDDASYVTVDGFTVTNTGLKGIAARGATPEDPMMGVVIKNNSISATQEEGMYLSEISSSLVENNTISDVGLGKNELTGHGIYLANAGSKNTVIRGNTLQALNNDWGQAIHVNGDLSTGGDGLITGLVIENNWILGGFNNGLSLDGVQDSDIRNNVIVNVGHHGIRAFDIDGAAGPKNLRIVNNTIQTMHGNAVKTTEEAGSSVVFNNILNGSDGATSFSVATSTSSNVTTFLAAASTYLPLGAALGSGVTSFNGVVAPTQDIDGKTRAVPYDLGAVAH